MVNNLQLQRWKKNMSQKDVSDATGINLSTYSKYEIDALDINKASLANIIKICLVLDCNLEDILSDDKLIKLVKKYQRKFKK